MFTNRLFNLIVAALVIVIAITFTSLAGSTEAEPTDHTAVSNHEDRYDFMNEIQVPNEAGLAQYHQSERTFVEMPEGMTIYLISERTMTPANFTDYQLSEWFGK